MNEFPIYGDLTKLDGEPFKGTFNVLCGGFPCQAFSHAAHGKNIAGMLSDDMVLVGYAKNEHRELYLAKHMYYTHANMDKGS